MKYKITANLDFDEDVLELDDDLTEEEVEKELYEYVSSFFDWGYRKVEDDLENFVNDLEVEFNGVRKMKYSDKDFKKADEETKGKIIEMVCDFFTHNFISKDALVEMVRYQNEKIKQLYSRYTCQEDLKDWINRNWFTIEECISKQINKSLKGNFNTNDEVDREDLAESIASEIKDGIINVIDTYEV